MSGYSKSDIPMAVCDICYRHFNPVSNTQVMCNECRDNDRKEKQKRIYRKKVNGMNKKSLKSCYMIVSTPDGSYREGALIAKSELDTCLKIRYLYEAFPSGTIFLKGNRKYCYKYVTKNGSTFAKLERIYEPIQNLLSGERERKRTMGRSV